MNAAFSKGEGAAALAYAQAESFVRFVARRGGSGAVRRVVELLLAGVELEAALNVGAGAGLAASWIAWRADLASDRTWMLTTGAQALVAVLLLAAVVLGLRRILARKRTIEQKWQTEGEPDSEPD
jgi:hypothetical protein